MGINTSREQSIREVLKDEPAFRGNQAVSALFQHEFSSWDEVSSLPKTLRERLKADIPWSTLSQETVLGGKKADTWKALLRAADGARIETVLMTNRRDTWTVCVSSQVGCAMNCSFCATGKMGFTRNLTVDEIVDQVRFWVNFLKGKPDFRQDITNIVYMGMGEPLANYDHVKRSLGILTGTMGIGMTRITVSTVGLVPMLEVLLADETWPPVRLAVSLHSANPGTRKDIMPTSYDEFLATLAGWAEKYFDKFDTNRRHLTFEYVLLAGVNDTEKHANALVRFARRVGKVKVNLIPYNYTPHLLSDKPSVAMRRSRETASLSGDASQKHSSEDGAGYTTGEYRKSSEEASQAFQDILVRAGITATRRRTMGDDIAAACGQLAAVTERGTNEKDVATEPSGQQRPYLHGRVDGV